MKQSIQKANARSLFSRCAKKVTACVLSAALLLACCPLALAAEPDTDPLTAQELAQMTDEQIAALSQEQSDATLNKMAQLFQDGEKQALDEYLSSLGFATTYEEYADQQGWNEEEQPDTEPSIQPMWQSDYDSKEPDKQCHEALTNVGFLVYVLARNELFNGGSIGFQLADLHLLSKESAWPDKDPSSRLTLFETHFYDPDTVTNWKGSSVTTARDSAINHYRDAIKKYYSGDRNGAIKVLAHCIHYVQDVAVPHHAANKVSIPLIDSYNHAGFEEFASRMMLDGQYTWDIESSDYFNLGYYNTWVSSSIGTSVHNIASTAKQYIDMVTDKDNAAGQLFIAYGMLGYSMCNTSGVLYKFAKEVGMI